MATVVFEVQFMNLTVPHIFVMCSIYFLDSGLICG